MVVPQFVSLAEAVAIVQDGMILAFGGMTMYRRPVGFVRALLQRQPRPANLTLVNFTAGFESDLLVGAGCIRTVRSVYFGLESFGFAPMFTEWAGRGAVEVLEETESSLASGFRAQMAGVGFMPSRAWMGTDLPRLRPDVRTVVDPYTHETLIAFPAIRADVAVIHALEADQHGNIKINNNRGVDLELVCIADTVIATVERIVENVVPSLDGFIIPKPAATFITHVPKGAYPTSCYPDYPIAGGELMRYTDACSAGAFDAYLESFLNDDPSSSATTQADSTVSHTESPG
ncbi:MAG: CoA-transferase [bacterium]|nr:CoA-transferase [bacterium]